MAELVNIRQLRTDIELCLGQTVLEGEWLGLVFVVVFVAVLTVLAAERKISENC